MKLYLNPDVIFKSKKTFSCVYHQGTGWYYPCKTDFWKTLQSYRGGRTIDFSKAPPMLRALVKSRFLIDRKTPNFEDLIYFYPIRVPGTVYYSSKTTVDVAVERKGASGEIDFDVSTLEGDSVHLWEKSDGNRNLGLITEKIGLTPGETIDLLRSWTSIENQLLRLLPAQITDFNEPPPQLIYKAPFLPKKAEPHASADDVHRYHLVGIKDGAGQFERIESTLSHLYRVPHPLLFGQSYGQALYFSINKEKEIRSGMRILEIGGGMGSISSDFLAQLKKDGLDVEYIIYDLSPALIRSQRELHKNTGVDAAHIHGNAEVLAAKDSSIDIAFSNEAIADFLTPEVTTTDVKDFLFDHKIPMTGEFFYSYREAPEKVRLNLGAFLLLKELYRVLKPGGLGVVTEFGHQDRLPYKADHLDHAEYSIQFAQMISVATALGFNLYLTDAYDFLGFRNDVKLMTHFSFQAALRIMEHHKTSLPNITYTEELFEKQLGRKAANFTGLVFVEPEKDPFKIVKVMVMHKADAIDNI